MSHRVIIQNVEKIYGEFKAVNNVSLDIPSGEFFTLLGPSGCGKTTLLRMIAGFNSIESGDILFDTQKMNDVPAHKREIGMVFQNYAIFPHLSVFDNVAYGLRARKLARAEIEKRVLEALDLIQIRSLKDRKPSQLSGGQQQRVALARAIVIEPKVLLMDEPLSNLDAKLRVQMRTIIKKLQRRLGITTIYVTHDQEEALAISDRIAVMKDGRLMQVGTPFDIYTKPRNRFVANFIGTSNSLHAELRDGALYLGGQQLPGFSFPERKTSPVILSVRPEQMKLVSPEEGFLTGKIGLATFLGDYVEYEVEAAQAELADQRPILVNEYMKNTDRVFSHGEAVGLAFDLPKVCVFPEDEEASFDMRRAEDGGLPAAEEGKAVQG